jgi:hypothetical protein
MRMGHADVVWGCVTLVCCPVCVLLVLVVGVLWQRQAPRVLFDVQRGQRGVGVRAPGSPTPGCDE